MVLLEGHTLIAGEKFTPESMNLALEERGGQASMVLGPKHPEIGLDDWMRDDTEPGKGIIWRVKSIETAYDTKTRTVTIEHIINTLRDRVIPEQVDASGTAAQAMQKAMSYQEIWKIGTVGYNLSAPFEFDGETVFDAITTVCTALEDPVWSFDLTQLPFTLNIMPRDTSPDSEMRVSRNLKTLSRTVDRTGMYTRIYPVGKDDMQLPEKYLEKNRNIYGLISKAETDQSQGTTEMLRIWAMGRLNRHCEPRVSITATGLDLSQDTGEALDRFTVGRICRVPLPEFGTTIREKITKAVWRDKIGSPKGVTLTLANEVEDIATFIREEAANGTPAAVRGGRGGARSAGEKHAWIIDADDHVGLLAEAVAGEGAATDWSRVASVMVDGKGIHERVTYTEKEIVTHEAAIEVNEKAISLEVDDRSEADRKLSGRIDVQADKISLVVDENGGIKSASIVAAINDSGSSVVISADHIQLEGQTFINKLTSAITKISLLKAIGISATNISASGYVEASTVRLKNGHGLGEAFIGAQLNPSGNNYELKFLKADGSWYGSSLSFSRAVASWGVTASGGAIRVTAQPQGQRKDVSVGVSGSRSISSNGIYHYDVIYENSSGDGSTVPGAGIDVSVSVEASYGNSARLTYTGSEKVGALTRYNYYSSDLITSSNRIVYW